MPADQNVASGIPIDYPTYDHNIRTNGLNDADEMSLYQPNALMDKPYAPADLEWLYRPQDVDGSSLSSRLANLAPVSFTNTYRRPAPAAAVRGRELGIESVRLGQ